MPKREKIVVHRDKVMEPIDDELDAAMERLDATNRQIGELLSSFEPPAPSTSEGADGVEPLEASADAAEGLPVSEE